LSRTLVAASLALLLSSALARAQTGATIAVTASDFRSANGNLRCYLFASREGYPTEPRRAAATVVAPIGADRTARCVFEAVAPGTYALALHHDEDADGEMDTGIFGIPTEGTGASRDARGSMGPPSFESAQFVHVERETTLRVRMAYVF
jgi:uncharacterized protein (DUF2141 family)